jgi:hypothetical protein
MQASKASSRNSNNHASSATTNNVKDNNIILTIVAIAITLVILIVPMVFINQANTTDYDDDTTTNAANIKELINFVKYHHLDGMPDLSIINIIRENNEAEGTWVFSPKNETVIVSGSKWMGKESTFKFEFYVGENESVGFIKGIIDGSPATTQSLKDGYDYGIKPSTNSNNDLPIFDKPEKKLPKNGKKKYEDTKENNAIYKQNIEDGYYGTIEITAPAGVANYYVLMKCLLDGEEYSVRSIIVRSGKTASMKVPLFGDGETVYNMYYASGNKWYGYKHLFGPDTSYSKADEDFPFEYRTGWEIELIPQIGGNLSTSAANASDFQ